MSNYKNAIISIEGRQIISGNNEEPIQLVTEGSFCIDGNSATIVYEESELTGLNGTTTTLRVDPNKVTMKRSGAVISEMVFENGTRHLSHFGTPFGSILLGISTQKLDNMLGLNGGTLSLRYSTDIDNTLASENTLDVRVSLTEGGANR